MYPETSVDRVPYTITDLFRESLMYAKHTAIIIKWKVDEQDREKIDIWNMRESVYVYICFHEYLLV